MTVACPFCLWDRSAQGADASLRLRVALRAHGLVWHPDRTFGEMVVGDGPARASRHASAA